MSKYEFSGYSGKALVYDTSTNTFRLDPGFKPAKDLVQFKMTDNDKYFDGDDSRDEIGDDKNQHGKVTNADGTQVGSGTIYVEQIGHLLAPDGTRVSIDRIEIDGKLMGYVPSQPLKPGVIYKYVGITQVNEGGKGAPDTRREYDYYEKSSVACFGPGTLITTREGNIPVEWLEPDDFLLTRDNGYQPILWTGRTTLPTGYFDRFPEDRPLRLPAGALGSGRPSRDLQLTGDHRILLCHPLAEALFFSSEVLVPAKAWDDSGVSEPVLPSRPYTLTHVLCADHQIVLANGAWVESLLLGPETLRRLSTADRAHLTGLLGDGFERQHSARRCVTRHEARALFGTTGRVASGVTTPRLRA
jgi:hypothetical protein